MSQIIHYLFRMMPAALAALAGYVVSYPFRQKRLTGRDMTTTAAHEVVLVAFLMFTAGLLWLTVLPEILWEDGHLILREEGFGKINLRPFILFEQARVLAGQGVRHYFLINFWGNIAMFIPLGLFPALLWRGGRWWKAVGTGFCLSLAIELCQIPINRGTDVDDLWLNTLGAAVGYGLYWLVKTLLPAWAEKCKIKCGRQ